MNKIFRTQAVDDGTTALLCGDNVFLTFYDQGHAEVLAINLNNIVNKSMDEVSLPKPDDTVN